MVYCHVTTTIVTLTDVLCSVIAVDRKKVDIVFVSSQISFDVNKYFLDFMEKTNSLYNQK